VVLLAASPEGYAELAPATCVFPAEALEIGDGMNAQIYATKHSGNDLLQVQTFHSETEDDCSVIRFLFMQDCVSIQMPHERLAEFADIVASQVAKLMTVDEKGEPK
jgi:hypothetical protein